MGSEGIAYPSDQYESSGRRYKFYASMYVAGDKEGTEKQFTNDHVITFEYCNELN